MRIFYSPSIVLPQFDRLFIESDSLRFSSSNDIFPSGSMIEAEAELPFNTKFWRTRARLKE